MDNYAFCNICKEIVPARHLERENKVFLQKYCPTCGINDHLVSNDALAYNKKRQFMRDVAITTCRLDCPVCERHKKPDIIFIDTTNRCNMNCHICLNNVAAMGFKYEPQLEFFERIFRHYSSYDPKPYVQLFGGEPTLREDLFDIISAGKSYGLSMRVVTNGLRLADEEYCRKLVEMGVMIHIAFDGSNRDMYLKLRGRADALDLKLRALGNLGKMKRGKVILMSVVDREQNRDNIPEILNVSLKNSHAVRGIYFMPLIHMWDKNKLDYDPQRTTLEDVEHMVNAAVEGGGVEFVPLGSLFLKNLYKFLGLKKMPFVGVHPNCESITYLVSDGEKLVPVSRYIKTSLYGLIGDLRRLEARLLARCGGRKVGLGARLLAYFGAFGVIRRHFNFGAAVGKKGPAAYFKWAKIIGKLLAGRKLKELLKSDTRLKGILQILVFPFEDYKTAEAQKLSMCSSSFVYIDPKTEEIKTLPTCTWERYKKPIMKGVAERFNLKDSSGASDAQPSPSAETFSGKES